VRCLQKEEKHEERKGLCYFILQKRSDFYYLAALRVVALDFGDQTPATAVQRL